MWVWALKGGSIYTFFPSALGIDESISCSGTCALLTLSRGGEDQAPEGADHPNAFDWVGCASCAASTRLGNSTDPGVCQWHFTAGCGGSSAGFWIEQRLVLKGRSSVVGLFT